MTTRPPSPADHHVVVIGAGQAGLATAHCLQSLGKRVTVVDACERIGDSWRRRYDSLVLFTPAQYSGLPDVPFPGERDTYPTKDEVADYLEAYAATCRLIVRTNCEVSRLTRERPDRFHVHTSQGDLEARQVVVATGAFKDPYIPAFAERLPSRVIQLHTSEYRNPGDVAGERVAVVGAGNSGAQIAEELSAVYDTTICSDPLARGFPQRLLGRDIFWWLLRTGRIARPTTHSGTGRPRLIGSRVPALLRRGQLKLRPRVVGADTGLQLAGGTELGVDTVIWATGFRNQFRWIDVDDAVDADGSPRHDQGVSPVPGLYYVGLPGLSSNGSAFLGFVGRDARRIASLIAHGS